MARQRKPDFIFFDEVETGEKKGYTFLEDYLEDNPGDIKVGDYLKVEKVVLVNSKKGYMICTAKFDYFVWRNNKITKQLIEALKAFVNEGVGRAIYVYVSKLDVSGLKLAAVKDETVNWYGHMGKYSIYPNVLVDDESITEGTGNMFLT